LFDSLNKEFTPGFHLVDIFSDYFSFTSVCYKDSKTLMAYQNRLDNVYENSLVNQDTVFIIVDTSIKKNITSLILYIYRSQEIITKYIHHTTNMTSTEVELFTIRYSINHAVQLQNSYCYRCYPSSEIDL